jgi:hypothetical protein
VKILDRRGVDVLQQQARSAIDQEHLFDPVDQRLHQQDFAE